MKIRRITVLLCLALALCPWAVGADGVVTVAAAAKKKAKKTKVCSKNARGKTTCKWVPILSGSNAKGKELRTEPLPVPSGELAFTSPNFREEFAAEIFDENGELDDAALAVLDHGFRSPASNEERAVDPRLYVLLAIIYDHFEKQPLELVSGFRHPERGSSRHHHAASCDFRIPGVKLGELHDFAKTLDTGGIGLGLYPTSGFIHLDIRAPGEPSYRWTDYTGSNKSKSSKKKATKKAPAKSNKSKSSKKKATKKAPVKKAPAKKAPAKKDKK